jgi:hypothetical protein
MYDFRKVHVKQFIFICILIVVLIITTNFIDSRVKQQYESSRLPIPTLECNSLNWFSQDIIRDNFHAPEIWGVWTTDGVQNVLFKSPKPKYQIVFEYNPFYKDPSFNFLTATDTLVSNRSANGIIDLTFEVSKIKNNFSQLTFQTNNSIRPVDVDSRNQDFRKLGVELRKFKFNCIL